MILGRGHAALLLGAALAACAPLPPPAPASLPRPVEPALSPRFITFVGPQRQHDPPFLGIAYTNFYCLRSFLDRESGATAYQLYVADSYFGAQRHWDAAHDEAGHGFPVTLIGSNKITCEDGCAYADEFAASLPADLLRASPDGLRVTFTARAGDSLTIDLSHALIASQLAAVDAASARLLPQKGAATAPPRP